MKKKLEKLKDIKVEKRSFKREVVTLLFFVMGILLDYGLYKRTDFAKLSDIIRYFYSFTFGRYLSFIIPQMFLIISIMTFRKAKKMLFARVVVSIMAITMILSGLYYIYGINYNVFTESSSFEYAGFIGFFIASNLISYMGMIPSVIVLITFLILALMLFINFRIYQLLAFILKPFDKIISFLIYLGSFFKRTKIKKEFEKSLSFEEDEYSAEIGKEIELASSKDDLDEESLFENTPVQEQISTEKIMRPRQNENGITISEKIVEKEEYLQNRKNRAINYVTPPVDLLTDRPKINDDENDEQFRENARLLQEKLLEFSVEAEVVNINPGPVITQYELKLAKGVKISRVNSLEKDLAMNLKAKSVRIVAPIPGKDTVGIEIPNKNPSIVSLKSIINSEKFIRHDSKLAIALGKTITGENYILDLKKTPHLLIAGATGSGKSVCINGIIMSILYRSTPEEVQFCMIDPKKVELSLYSDLVNHHLLKVDGIDEAVVTKPEDALRLLEALVDEMERRYDVLMESGLRNLEEYNNAIEAGEIDYSQKTGEKFVKLPYIVSIVDEYGDLMMTSGKAVEDPICRLAQMSRAVGIHMVLATQRPSVKVVTGVIKANFPTRIGFRVMSQIDSRTILDQKGAESLLGKGDMLIIPPGDADAIRIQNALVETKEVNRVVDFIKKQNVSFDRISIKAKPKQTEGMEAGFGDDYSDDLDPLYEEAKRMVVSNQMASVSMLQRGLSVGYARAGKLIDQLERTGVVGPHVGSKSREVLKADFE
ncbi:MAG: DNA translocase FtsK 4TM domain-containing protein [Candidatus Delongbacteria bacterium]|nr:DNA translocase FtsK 4TM domain-containing protein [Candidatus Delongbacteria bacterium]MBN2834763.1 DNA translocase FtsK 4TM domain-containing protein [Candidatus Delongbacteria bacterium]